MQVVLQRLLYYLLMELQQNVPLSIYSTMRLGGHAAYLLEITDTQTLIEAVNMAQDHNLPVIVVGNGSNIIWRDEGFPGLVLVNRIQGFETTTQDDEGAYLTIGAGENWDSVVQRTVEMGLSGIECLSLIPGTVGATPVQNVGAYGQDISQVLMTLTAYDSKVKNMVTLTASDCNFGYRKSIFNTTEKGRYFITSITILLSKNKPMPPFYPAVTSYLDGHGIKAYTATSLRQAVVDIRSSKLPDPNVTPNCGSFFGNPIVDRSVYSLLEEDYPNIPHWMTEDGQVKLSAAWLIDQVGFHDFFDEETGMATWSLQPLVFINHSAKSTADLMKFSEKVKSKVRQQFNIDLVQEPLLLP